MKKFLAVALALAVLSALALTVCAHSGHKTAWGINDGVCQSCGGCLYDGICRNESCPGSQNGGVCVNDGVCQNNGGVCRSGSYAHGGHHAW